MYIRSVSGITGLRSFENLGQSVEDSDIDNGVIAYMAKAVFEFETVAWTKVTVNNVFPTLWTGKEDEEYPFFRLEETDNLYYSLFEPEISVYSVSWKHLDIDNINEHRYNGYFPVDLHIDPGLLFSGGFELGGVTFDTPSLKANIIDVHIEDSYDKNIGKYTDTFVDIAGVKEGYVDFTIIDETNILGNREKMVVDWLNGLSPKLGWQSGDIEEGVSYIQGLRSPDPDGSSLPDKISGDELGTSNLWTCYMHYDLQPQVDKSIQYVKINKASLEWDSLDTFLSPPAIRVLVHPHIDTLPERVVGVHIYNQMIHYDCLAEVEFVMTIKTDGVMSESFLADPNLYLSDMVWDISFMGDSIVHIVFAPVIGGDIWDIIWLIIVIIGIVVFVYVFIQIGPTAIKGTKKVLKKVID